MDLSCRSNHPLHGGTSHEGGRRRVSQTADLFRQLRQFGDSAARERLVGQFMPLARHVARRYETAGSWEDVRQVAYLGLVRAVDGFDPDRGTSFASYAVPTITGEVRRYLRDFSWDMHMPRGLQERVYRLRRANDQLTRQQARPPTLAELTVALDATRESVLETLAAAEAHDLASLDAPLNAGTSWPRSRESTQELASFENGFERVVERDCLRLALASLSERKREMIALRFFGGMTQSQIAARLGVSQVRVCRVLREAMQEMSHTASLAKQPSAPSKMPHDRRSFDRSPSAPLRATTGATLASAGVGPRGSAIGGTRRAQADRPVGWRRRSAMV